MNKLPGRLGTAAQHCSRQDSAANLWARDWAVMAEQPGSSNGGRSSLESHQLGIALGSSDPRHSTGDPDTADVLGPWLSEKDAGGGLTPCRNWLISAYLEAPGFCLSSKGWGRRWGTEWSWRGKWGQRLTACCEDRHAGKKEDTGLPTGARQGGLQAAQRAMQHAMLLGEEHANDEVPVQFVWGSAPL